MRKQICFIFVRLRKQKENHKNQDLISILFLSTSVISTYIYTCLYKIFCDHAKKSNFVNSLLIPNSYTINNFAVSISHAFWVILTKSYAKMLRLVDNVLNNGCSTNVVCTMNLLIILHILKQLLTFKESVP